MNEDFSPRAGPPAVLQTPFQAPAVDRTAAAARAAGTESGGVEADFAWLIPLAAKAIGSLFG
ncbi:MULTISPECIES: hypothetical protein [unclassified Streptomyces]|uniref:hypothetical protein n=1 Tax=unclassified Streptomyces TaxID=2593676 RepID=UPI002E0E839E|nr:MULTISPECIES: hypothetical protein [unclassified Streptomyces]WSR23993.1 hypothetical protein OG573_36330 [Streptomyces sp. NBC_01205]